MRATVIAYLFAADNRCDLDGSGRDQRASLMAGRTRLWTLPEKTAEDGAMKMSMRETLVNLLINENPITLQILGVCSALAATKTVATALILSAAVIFVITLSNMVISLIRHHRPRHVRLGVLLGRLVCFLPSFLPM